VRAELSREVEVGVPVGALWELVTDWPRQREWVPATRVEPVAGPSHAVGERFRAWTGLGPPALHLGFWDAMTVTGWCPPDGVDEPGWCEVLHTGAVVRGVGQIAVRPCGPGRSRMHWFEGVHLPAGPLGRTAWWVLRPLVARGVDVGLRRLRALAEAEHG
jgi:hypothetical protein